MYLFRRVRFRAVLTTVAVIGSSVAVAAVLDNFGPPPPGDPSAFTGPAIGNAAAITELARAPPTNAGAFAGGATGTYNDAHENVVVRAAADRRRHPGRRAAEPALRRAAVHAADAALRGVRARSLARCAGAAQLPFPQPVTGAAPENDPNDIASTGQRRRPRGLPRRSRASRRRRRSSPTITLRQNPWKAKIEAVPRSPARHSAGRGSSARQGLVAPALERVHPRVFFKTAQAGARENLGMRDSKQRHGYTAGEFARAASTTASSRRRCPARR